MNVRTLKVQVRLAPLSAYISVVEGRVHMYVATIGVFCSFYIILCVRNNYICLYVCTWAC